MRRCSSGSRPARRSSCATGRCSSSPTPAACAAEEIVNLDLDSLDFDAEQLRVDGKGGEDAARAGRRARAARAQPLPRARPPRPRRRPAASRRCSSRRAAGASPTPTSAAACSAGCARRRSPAASRRTRCATPSRPICSRAAPTCARSRSCSATPVISTTQVYTRVEPARLRERVRSQLIRALEEGARLQRERLHGNRASRRSSSGTSGAATRRRATQRARERLVVAYSPLVKFVAGRIGAGLPSHVEEADLISYGLIGLIGAIERFEPEREIKFETFAMHADPRRDHRRAALARLGAALGALPRPRDRAGATRSSSTSCSARPTEEELAERARDERRGPPGARCWRSPTPRSSRSTSSGPSPTPPATRSRCSTRSTTTSAPDPQAALDTSELKDRLADAIQAPARARDSSSSPSTTTRT